MRARTLVITAICILAASLCYLPCCAFAEGPCELTDVELEHIYAGNTDGEWIDFEVDAVEGVTPFFMGDVNITDSAMENLRAMVSVVAAGSVINISLNVALIEVNNTGSANIDVDFFSDVTNSLNITNLSNGM